ncbi:hypothetical protein C9374_004889 [Naegleria lovaniensis]|uniref:Uncharacterized protein n=1 Tax=Naegleria lovaniensis TaxID=51637 RepID=A0AA88KJ55_NAELO|nr:uncharacterized protein C9374_004889 [Naegleria lovaniensis]KAG2382922.1 hypothetical protein C9374_004889 [Naegleria lovaniensis]
MLPPSNGSSSVNPQQAGGQPNPKSVAHMVASGGIQQQNMGNLSSLSMLRDVPGSSSGNLSSLSINSTSLIQSDSSLSRYSTSPNQYDQYLPKKKRTFNHEKYFVMESILMKDSKSTANPASLANASKIYFVNDFFSNMVHLQHVLPDVLVQHIFSFITFPLASYLKRFFHHQNRQFTYDYQQLVSESKNDQNLLIPDFIKENVVLIQTWKEITKLLFGKRKKQLVQSSSASMDCTDDHTESSVGTASTPFLLWRNVDCSVQSCYEYDQETPLNTKQIRTVLSTFTKIISFDFSGNTSFNNRCLKYLMARSPNLQSLNVKVTRVDYDGFNYLLNKTENGEKYNDTLRELKLTKFLRASIPASDFNFFSKLRKLHSLEMVNHQLNESQVLSIIQVDAENYRPFIHLNLSGCQIPTEISNVKTLTSLVLEDCNITPELAKSLLNNLPRLKHLDLSKNNGLTPDVFENISQHESLSHLRLTGTDVSDEVVKNISKNGSISILDLDYTKITVKGMKCLFGVGQEDKLVGKISSSLSTLCVRNCGLSQTELKKEIPLQGKAFSIKL